MPKTVKVLTLTIKIVDGMKVDATLTHRCKSPSDALDLIQTFVDKHRKGESIDGEISTQEEIDKI